MKLPGVVKRDDHDEDVRLLLSHLPESFSFKGVMHVGAHKGEEVEAYLRMGFHRVVLIEANPEWSAALHERFRHEPRVQIVSCAVADRHETLQLYLHTSRSGSTEPASLLQLGELGRILPTMKTVKTIPVSAKTLSSLYSEYHWRAGDFDLLVLDVQGAEMMALKGATEVLQSFDAIVSEVNVIQTYKECPVEAEIRAYLEKAGFQHSFGVYHELYDSTSRFVAWGEVLYLAKKLVGK